MADSDRVAGIYSEVQYRFDRKSIQNLRKFKRDLMELKSNLKHIRTLTRKNVKIGFDAKTAKVSQRVSKASKETTKYTQDAAKNLGKQNKMRERSVRIERNRQKAEMQSAKIAANARKQELAIESKIASQRAKVARMAGGAERLNPRNKERLLRVQKRLNEAYRRGSISASQFNTQSQRLTNILQRQSHVTQNATMSFNRLRTALAGATGAYSAFAGASGIKNIGGQFEDAQIMLETAMGGEAGETLEFLIQQSQRLGIGATETAKGFARYTLAGKQMGFTNEQLKEQFLGVVEAATVFGLRQEEITGTIRAKLRLTV